MGKKGKLPQTRLEVLRDDWGTYSVFELWIHVAGFPPSMVTEYGKRSDAIRGAKRFATKILTTNERRQITKLDIYCDGELVG